MKEKKSFRISDCLNYGNVSRKQCSGYIYSRPFIVIMVSARVLLLKGYILIAYILYFHIIFLSKHKLLIHVGLIFNFKPDTK